MGEAVPIIFLAVILKIPVLYGMWLIWWAVKDEPELEDLPGREVERNVGLTVGIDGDQVVVVRRAPQPRPCVLVEHGQVRI